MKTHYDPETDAPIEASEEVAPGIVLDFDATRRLVGFEILNARTNLAAGAIPNLEAAE